MAMIKLPEMLMSSFFLKKKKKEGRENNSAVYALLCVRLSSENMLVRGAWDLCSLWSWLLFNNHTDNFWETLNNKKLYLS